MSRAKPKKRASDRTEDPSSVAYEEGQKVFAKIRGQEFKGEIQGHIFPDLWIVNIGKPYSELTYNYSSLLVLGCNLRLRE